MTQCDQLSAASQLSLFLFLSPDLFLQERIISHALFASSADRISGDQCHSVLLRAASGKATHIEKQGGSEHDRFH